MAIGRFPVESGQVLAFAQAIGDENPVYRSEDAAQAAGLDGSSHVVVYALAAMALNFLLGYTGVLSFGHAAYFGLGAYGTAMTIKYLVPSTAYHIGDLLALDAEGLKQTPP